MSNYDVQQLTTVFKVIGDPRRQQIMFLLRRKGELTVGEIARAIEATQPATSQHLGILKNAGVLVSRKSGLQVYYRLCSKRLYDAVVTLVTVYQEEIAKAHQKDN